MVLTMGAMVAGAGIYKWASPTIVPATSVPPLSTFVPEPNLSPSLLIGLLKEYVSDKSSPGRTCLTRAPSPLFDIDLTVGKRYLRNVQKAYLDGKWTVRATGEECSGLEIWEIDDVTGAIEYLGSKLASP